MSSAAEFLVRGGRPTDGARRPRRVAVITDEASMGVEAVAALARTSAAAPDLRQQTEMRIRHCADPAASVRDFVDLTPKCSAPSLEAAVDALADDPGCDAVLVALAGEDGSHTRTLVGTVLRFGRDHPGTSVVVVCPSAQHAAHPRVHDAPPADHGGRTLAWTGRDPAARPGSDR